MVTGIYEYVIAQLQQHKGRWREVAEQSGVSRRTLEKIARKEIPNPGIHSVEALARHFSRESQ